MPRSRPSVSLVWIYWAPRGCPLGKLSAFSSEWSPVAMPYDTRLETQPSLQKSPLFRSLASWEINISHASAVFGELRAIDRLEDQLGHGRLTSQII